MLAYAIVDGRRQDPPPIEHSGHDVKQQFEKAEVAARRGDVDQALSILDDAYNEIEELPTRELADLAQITTRIAETLETRGRYNGAIRTWMFVIRIYELAEDAPETDRAWEALRAVAGRQNLKGDPSRSK